MTLANRITVARLFIIPVFAGSLLYWPSDVPNYHRLPAALFTLACLSDALDGSIARWSRQKTRLGVFLDPLSDKTLLVIAYLGLAFLNMVPEPFRLPVWLALLVISRDALLVGGAILIHAVTGGFDPRVNLLGKTTTFFQMLFVTAVLWNVPQAAGQGMLITVAGLTLLSGLAYLKTGAALAAAHER